MPLTSAEGEYSAERPVGTRVPFGRWTLNHLGRPPTGQALPPRGPLTSDQHALPRGHRHVQSVAGRREGADEVVGEGARRELDAIEVDRGARPSASGASGWRKRNRKPVSPLLAGRERTLRVARQDHGQAVGRDGGEHDALVVRGPTPGNVRKSTLRIVLEQWVAVSASGPQGAETVSTRRSCHCFQASVASVVMPPFLSSVVDPPARGTSGRPYGQDVSPVVAYRLPGRARPRCSRRVPPG